MSSHHIIRDKQEPALIIANGEACSLDLVEQLLEWSPTVVVLDGALERVISLGIKVDVWLGDFDHTYEADYTDYPLKKIHTPDQNLTDLEKAFESTSFKPKNRLPIAKMLGDTSLMFLVHPTLTQENIKKTKEVIAEVLKLASL